MSVLQLDGNLYVHINLIPDRLTCAPEYPNVNKYSKEFASDNKINPCISFTNYLKLPIVLNLIQKLHLIFFFSKEHILNIQYGIIFNI